MSAQRQARAMVVASFLSSLGLGLYVTGSTVYFVRSVGLTAFQVGAGLSVAGLVGLAAGVAAGFLADRLGPRGITVALKGLMAPLLIAFTQVRSFWAFLVIAVVLSALMVGSDVGRSAWVANLVVDQAERARLTARTRSSFNVGFSLGLLGAGLAIAANTRPAYLALFAGAAVATAVTCPVQLRLPGVRPTAPSRSRGRPSALRDLPYIWVAQVSGLTRLGDTILTVGLPLWIVTRTAAPQALAAWLLIVNTVLVVLLQGRAAKRAATTAGAAVIQQWAFGVLALTCVVVWPSVGLPTVPAVAVLIAATVLITLGEIWGEGAWWALRYGLAPAGSQGQYGGVFMLGQAVPSAVGPVMVTTLTCGVGPVGWLILAGLFGACATFSRQSVAVAERAVRQRADPG
jgi:Major Facilitator Superfamily